MSHNASYYLKNGLLTLFVIIVAGYSFFQIRNIIFGPSISIQSPLDGQTYTHALIDVTGVAENTNYLTLDDKPIFTDTKGNFSEKILLGQGSNTIKLYAENKFGKKNEKIIQIILQDAETHTPPSIPTTSKDTKPKNTATSTKIATTTENAIPSASTTLVH